jgi:hypothetical protein
VVVRVYEACRKSVQSYTMNYHIYWIYHHTHTLADLSKNKIKNSKKKISKIFFFPKGLPTYAHVVVSIF